MVKLGPMTLPPEKFSNCAPTAMPISELDLIGAMIPTAQSGSLAIFQVVCQKHGGFPNLKSEVKNLAVLRFSMGFVRNMWFFKT